MADNVGYTPGTGATVAADDIGGVLYQQELIRREQERVRKEREEAEELQMLLDYMINEV